MKKVIMLLAILVIHAFGFEISDFINKQNCDQIIDKQIYSVCYDFEAKGAKYVAYELDGRLVNAVNIKKRSSFYTEKNLPKKYRSHTRDYTRTGYDRGHLANDGSFDYDEKVVRKTYSMANIIPMSPQSNRYLWIKSERLERQISSKLGSAIVINGVVYSSNPKRIGRNQIAVPDGFWKMIYNKEKGYERCFYYENNNNIDPSKDKLKDHLFDCSRLMR